MDKETRDLVNKMIKNLIKLKAKGVRPELAIKELIKLQKRSV